MGAVVVMSKILLKGAYYTYQSVNPLFHLFVRQKRFYRPMNLYQKINFRLFQTLSLQNPFKFDENGRKLIKWVEDTVGKGDIAQYELPHSGGSVVSVSDS